MIEDPESSRKILFLPGAGGSPAFWRPVADRLPAGWTKVHFGWPGPAVLNANASQQFETTEPPDGVET